MRLNGIVVMLFVINLSKVEFIIGAGKEEQKFAHMVKYFFWNKLGMNADKVSTQIRHRSVPSYMHYMYTLMDTLDKKENQNGYLKQDINSDQTIVAVNPKTRLYQRAKYSMIVSLVDENIQKYHGGEIVFQLKENALSRDEIPLKSKICDVVINFCVIVDTEVKSMKNPFRQWMIIDATPLLIRWNYDSSFLDNSRITIDFTHSESLSNNLFVMSGSDRPNLLLFSDPSIYYQTFDQYDDDQSNYTDSNMPVISRNARSIPNYNIDHEATECQMYKWEINFASIGWDSFIVQPLSLGIHYCAGACDEPLQDHINKTHHSFFRSHFRSMFPKKYDFLPPPKCVPTSLSPKTMIYKKGVLNILQRSSELIVNHCGCW